MAKRKKGESLMIDELVRILEQLQKEGINVSKIKKSKDKRFTLLIDEVPKAVIDKLGLDEKYPIGSRITTAISAYNKIIYYPITEEHRKKLEQLEIVSIKKTIDITELSMKEKRQQELREKQRKALELYDSALISWAQGKPKKSKEGK